MRGEGRGNWGIGSWELGVGSWELGVGGLVRSARDQTRDCPGFFTRSQSSWTQLLLIRWLAMARYGYWVGTTSSSSTAGSPLQ